MNQFPFIGPGGLKEQHRRKAFEFWSNYGTSSKVCVVLPTAEWDDNKAAHLAKERKRRENLIVGALDSWGASPQAVYRAVTTYDNR